MLGIVAKLPKRLQAHDTPTATHVTCTKTCGVSISTPNSQRAIWKMCCSVYSLDLGIHNFKAVPSLNSP